MAGVIDADTHIAEPEAMWKFFDEDMYPRRPVLTSITDDTLYGPATSSGSSTATSSRSPRARAVSGW